MNVDEILELLFLKKYAENVVCGSKSIKNSSESGIDEFVWTSAFIQIGTIIFYLDLRIQSSIILKCVCFLSLVKFEKLVHVISNNAFEAYNKVRIQTWTAYTVHVMKAITKKSCIIGLESVLATKPTWYWKVLEENMKTWTWKISYNGIISYNEL